MNTWQLWGKRTLVVGLPVRVGNRKVHRAAHLSKAREACLLTEAAYITGHLM